VERLDGLEAPGLALLPVGFRPADGLPVGGEHQARAGVGKFDAVAGGLPDVEEERPLDRVLVRPVSMWTPFWRKMSAARRMSSRWSVA
jgi:hypothetical protein